MSWSYIPYSPTADAWNARPFKNQYKLQDVMQCLREHIPRCQGQLVFRTDDIPKHMKENVMEVEGRYYVPYNHMNELYEFMEYIKWNEKKNLDKVVIYRTGYFIQ